MSSPLFVICDRCRAEGVAGDDPFTGFGALLDFDPVPRRTHRADGWDADVQRAYIAALALTGSDRAACRAVGRSAFGINQLLAHEESDGFRAARDEALAIAADERSRRLAEGLRTVAAEQAGWRPADPPWSKAATRACPEPGRRGRPLAQPEGPAVPPHIEEERTLAALEALFRHYMERLELERTARLAGKVVAADFYVRQISVFEIGLDLLSGPERDAFKLIRDLSVEGHHLVTIAETTMSRLLDEARRAKWAELGEPDRPPLLTDDQMVDRSATSCSPAKASRARTSRPRCMRRKRNMPPPRKRRWNGKRRRAETSRTGATAPREQSRETRPAGRRGAPESGANSSDVTNSVRDGSSCHTPNPKPEESQ